MGCLNANIGVILDKVIISVTKINPDLVISIMPKMPFELKAKFSIVCAPNKEAFIRLSPDVLWFFSENDRWRDATLQEKEEWEKAQEEKE